MDRRNIGVFYSEEETKRKIWYGKVDSVRTLRKVHQEDPVEWEYWGPDVRCREGPPGPPTVPSYLSFTENGFSSK